MAEESGFILFRPAVGRLFENQFMNYGFEESFVGDSSVISRSQYDYLKGRFFWGLGSFESDGGNAVMYFYDRLLKKHGKVILLTNNHPKMRNNYFPVLMDGYLSLYNVDEVIARQVNRVILSVLVNNCYMPLLAGRDIDRNDRALFDGDLLRIQDSWPERAK